MIGTDHCKIDRETVMNIDHSQNGEVKEKYNRLNNIKNSFIQACPLTEKINILNNINTLVIKITSVAILFRCNLPTLPL